jgi:hypothetical protein
MKAMSIKAVVLFLITSFCVFAQGDMPEANMPHGDMGQTKIEVKKVTKGKNGEFIISWGLLAQYDLKKNSLSSELKKVVGKEVSINGFMVPLDYSARNVSEFLLVPYIPSCSHVPPPEANLIIMVKVGGKVKRVPNSFEPIRVVGKLTIPKRTKKPDPYMMEGVYNLVSTSVKVEK